MSNKIQKFFFVWTISHDPSLIQPNLSLRNQIYSQEQISSNLRLLRCTGRWGEKEALAHWSLAE